MSGEPVLSLHHPPDPEWTAHLQQLLVDRGYDPGPVDGIFGERTDAAVRRYQWDQGLGADGVVGPLTWESLNGGSGSGPPTPAGTGQEGDGEGSSDVPSAQATCHISRFDDFGIEVDITNDGEWAWGHGDVAYDLSVTREDVLVQQSNDSLAGVEPYGTVAWTEPFLGTHFPGRYVATLVVIDLTTHAAVASDQAAYTKE